MLSAQINIILHKTSPSNTAVLQYLSIYPANQKGAFLLPLIRFSRAAWRNARPIRQYNRTPDAPTCNRTELYLSCASDSYNETDLQSAVQRHFELLNIQIAPDARVVIKPNLIMRCGPERAATTHPALVEAVVCQLQAMGVRDITIADSMIL